jgi:hypothetical protein
MGDMGPKTIYHHSKQIIRSSLEALLYPALETTYLTNNNNNNDFREPHKGNKHAQASIYIEHNPI